MQNSTTAKKTAYAQRRRSTVADSRVSSGVDTPPALIEIAAPNFQVVEVPIVSTSKLVMNRFGPKAAKQMLDAMTTTVQQKNAQSSKKKRKPKDLDAEYEDAFHRSTAGWYGIPCVAFRSAMIDSCRVTSMAMTVAKQCITDIKADGVNEDGDGLVRIFGRPKKFTCHVRNANGSTDLRCRLMWEKWKATVRIEYDADQVSASSVVNLLHRGGAQGGIAEGRNTSKKSHGQGWGKFTTIVEKGKAS